MIAKSEKIKCLVQVDCDQCGSRDSRALFYAKDLQWSLPGTFRIARCNNCGLVYLSPRPSAEEFRSYHSGIWEGLLGENEDGKTALERVRDTRQFTNYLRKRVESIERYKRRGRILDVGCGTGDFLALMEEKNWEIAGVEIARGAAECAKEKLGEAVFCGGFEETHFPDAHFDVVTLYSVLEHLSSPKTCLGEIHRIMKNDGLLVILVPNFGGLQAKLFKKYWYALVPPFHLFHFTPETIYQMLESAGFDVLRFDHFDSIQSPYSFKLSTIFLLKGLLGLDETDCKDESAQLRNGASENSVSANTPSLRRRAALFTLEQFSRVVAFTEGLVRKGAIFSVYAQKRG